DRERALFPADLFAWLKATQPAEWTKHEASSKGHAEGSLLDRLLKLMEEHGSLWVLRNTAKAVAARFDLCQFKPSHGLNPATLAKYQQNRLRVMRQVHYSTSNQNSIDLVGLRAPFMFVACPRRRGCWTNGYRERYSALSDTTFLQLRPFIYMDTPRPSQG